MNGASLSSSLLFPIASWTVVALGIGWWLGRRSRTNTLDPKPGAQDEREPLVPEPHFSFSTPPAPKAQKIEPPRPSREMLLVELDRLLETAIVPGALLERGLHWIAELTQSPVLFFRYQRGRDLALLTHVEGMGDTLAPGSLRFSLQHATVTPVLQLAERFELASFGRFGPLNRLMLNDLGVAHFEAWALIPFSHLNHRTTAFPPGFTPELHGVVVIVHSGIESSLHRKTLLGALEKLGYHLGLTHEFTHPGTAFRNTPSVEH